MEYPWARMAALMSEPKVKRRPSRSGSGRKGAAPEQLSLSVERLHHEIRGLIDEGGRESQAAAVKRFLELTELIEANPGALPLSMRSVHRLRAIAMIQEAKYAAAFEIYPKRAPRELSYARWVLEKGLIALNAGKGESVYGELLDAWQRVSSKGISPLNHDLAARLSEALGAYFWQRGEWSAAIHWWSRAFSLGRIDVAEPLAYSYYRLGLELRSEEPTRAFRLWKAAAAIGGELRPAKAAAALCAKVHLIEAFSYWQKGRIAQAARHWKRAIEYQPERLPFAHLGLAFACAQNSEWESVQAHAEAAIQAMPESREALLLLTAALVMQGKFEAAAEHALELTEASPGDVELEALWSLLLLAAGEEPAKVYEQVATLARDSAHPNAVEGALLAARACGRMAEVKDLLETSALTLWKGDAFVKTLIFEVPPRIAAGRFVKRSAERLFDARLEREYTLPKDPKEAKVEYRAPELPGIKWWLAEGAWLAPSPP